MAVASALAAPPVDEIARYAEDVDREARFPSEAIAALERGGLLGLGVPERLGGPGGDAVDVVDVVEAIAGACASTAMVYLMHVAATQTLVAGTAEDDDGPKTDTLRAIAACRHVTTLAYSERGSRGHFWAQTSRARRDGNAVVIDAEKTFATAAGHVSSYVVATGAPEGSAPTDTQLYLVDAGSAGMEIPRRFDGLGLRGNASAPLRLTGVRVTEDRRLGDPLSGFGLMLGATLPWFVLGSAACSAGIAGAALRSAVAHAGAARLEHVGASLAELPAVRERLARAQTRLAETRAYVREVARLVATGDEAAQLGVLAVKAAAADMAAEVTELCLRVGGGAAYAKHGPLERHFRDARAAGVMAPTTDVLHDFVGRAITGQELF
jgi:alkylation response protein AidB-like acyl-CoA dehydrogenase